jgi:hypothetical protein
MATFSPIRWWARRDDDYALINRSLFLGQGEIDFDLYMPVNQALSPLQALNDVVANPTVLVWSPVALQLAVIGQHVMDISHYGIFLIDPQTQVVTPVVTDSPGLLDGTLEWTSDGTHLVYLTSAEGRLETLLGQAFKLHWVDITSGQAVELTLPDISLLPYALQVR